MNFEKILSYEILGISVLDLSISIGIFILAMILSNFISKSIVTTLKKLASKTKTKLDDELISILESPLRVSIILLGFYISKQWLKLDKIDTLLNNIIKSLATFIIFWILYKIVDN